MHRGGDYEGIAVLKQMLTAISVVNERIYWQKAHRNTENNTSVGIILLSFRILVLVRVACS